MAELSREDFAKMNERHAKNNPQKNNPKISLPPKEDPPPKAKSKDLLGLLNFKNIELDSDRIIIIALALLLCSEEADELLIMALIYIML